MRIAVIDGQGGGIGKIIIERLKKTTNANITIIALGTNSMATSNMLKAGAKEGATGENAIIYNSSRVDVIIGPIGIIIANSMLGELTPKMARAITESPSVKILIPFNKCNVYITGIREDTISAHIEEAVQKLISLSTK